MASLRSQGVDSVTDLVQKYLQDADPPGTVVEERSHVAQLCSECIKVFQISLKALRAENDSRSKKRTMMDISLERSYGRMKIWSDENGAADGRLDATLAASRDLQRDTLRYIVSISQTLTERLINFVDIELAKAGHECVSALRSLTTAVTEGDSDSSSDSEVSDSSVDSFKDVLEDLTVDTTCLLDLEPLICSPILRTDPEGTAVLDTTQIRWTPHQPYSDKISARFPMAADDLVARLGRANYERYLRCQEQKATNDLGDIPSEQAAAAVPDSASSKFHDSGIGSSIHPTTSTYAETVMSYGMGEGRRIRVPPLPDRAKEGLPFACVACGKWVKIATNSAWKKHVYEDLQPWICLEADCHLGTDTFPTRKDWITHLALDHGMDPEWGIIECLLCRVEIGPGKLLIMKHMSDHLEEISLSALPIDCEFDEESEGCEPDREDEDIKGSVQSSLRCTFCHQTFSREYELRRHMRFEMRRKASIEASNTLLAPKPQTVVDKTGIGNVPHSAYQTPRESQATKKPQEATTDYKTTNGSCPQHAQQLMKTKFIRQYNRKRAKMLLQGSEARREEHNGDEGTSGSNFLL